MFLLFSVFLPIFISVGRSNQSSHNNTELTIDDNDLTLNQTTISKQQPKRKKRNRGTDRLYVEKRPERLNAPLKLLPEDPDPIFYRLNLIQGDIDCPLRLFTNLLSTKTSDLNLVMNDKYFDVSPREKIVFQEEYECSNYVSLPVSLLPLAAINAGSLKQQLSGYTIKNVPIEDNEYSEM